LRKVERLWPGSTVVCIGSGPSLTREDVEAVRGRARVIAINNGYQLAPWADALYASDGAWWRWHEGAPTFGGLKFSLKGDGEIVDPGVMLLENRGLNGLESDPAGLRHGKNSGYQAIGLAVHLGAARIVLLGYDLQLGPAGEKRWHAPHKDKAADAAFDKWLPQFATLVEPLRERGIEIVNCSRRTALTCFPRQLLEDALVGRSSRAA
jgi:hypothetical protein